MPSTLRYEVVNTSEESVVIDGLGVIPPKTTASYDEEAAKGFQFTRGLPLTQVRMPEGAKLYVEVTPSASNE